MILLMLSKSVTFLATPPPGSQGLYENLSFIAEILALLAVEITTSKIIYQFRNRTQLMIF